jgi:RNA polymerase sigma-70 factor, ECF subfamily
MSVEFIVARLLMVAARVVVARGLHEPPAAPLCTWLKEFGLLANTLTPWRIYKDVKPAVVERGIVERARERGGADLEALLAAVWPETYRIAASVLRDRGLAEDAAQEACATIARALPSLRSLDAFATWSYKIAVTAALAAARQRSRAQSLDELDPTAEAGLDRGDALDLYRALGRLRPIQRAVILLHYYAGQSSSEIADATGVPSSTVRFHLMRARSALREALEGESRAVPCKEVLTDVQ